MRRLGILAVILVLGAPAAARAVDAPHEAGYNCKNCHVGHNASGGSLTNVAGNYNLCNSCHVSRGRFGNWSLQFQAVPGTGGRSHSWSGSANNSAMGATAPNPTSADAGEAAMGQTLDNGNLQCSTCHDQHQSDTFAGRGTQYVQPVTPVASGTGSVTVDTPVGSAATPNWDRVQIVAAGDETSATFKLSHDRGKSWFGCSSPGTYVAYVDSPSNACAVGAGVALDDGSNVHVTFAAGTYVAGDYWEFYVGYPYLRADNTDAAICTTCHKGQNMTWQNVEGSGTVPGTGQPVVPGTTVFSHPVAQALDANGKHYDRASILDADGQVQPSNGDGDGGVANPTNDLVLGSGGVVTCLTCHHPHGADSNSLSIDAR